MITFWRQQFEQSTLPFFYVLLAAGHTALLREAQVAGASRLPNTAFASAVDLGAAKNEYLIPGHPPRKQEVGRRLSLLNRAIVYKEELDYQGPQVMASNVSVVQVTQSSGDILTTVVIPFIVGANGHLHLNGTGGCDICCGGARVAARYMTNDTEVLDADTRSNASSPVAILDPDASGEQKVTKTGTFHIDSAQGILTATLSGWTTTAGRAEVRFLFDNAPQCAVYNGLLSGPDSVYAPIKHFGIVAQSWRGNVTVVKA